MRKEEFREILINIPISINAQLGDPFQETQWENTKGKLLKLEQQGHKGPVALITKSVLNEEQIKAINDADLDIFIFLSLTGLNENRKVTFEQVKENYIRLCNTNKNVVIFIRPIIPGYNDSIEVIEPIIKLAGMGQKNVIIRGYKDIYNLDEKAKINLDFLQLLKNICTTYNVKVFDKTMYYVSSIRENHFVNKKEISNNSVQLLKKLGYPVELVNGELIFTSKYHFSQGDLNFIRMVTGKKIDMTLEHNDAIMTIKNNERMLDCSSSWFGWARRIPCQINCWYCISKVEEFNKDKAVEIGCCPADLLM